MSDLEPRRRTMLSAAAWSAPAVAVAGASPAFADSTLPPFVENAACATQLTLTAEWTTTNASYKSAHDTGWYDEPRFVGEGVTSNFVCAENKEWYKNFANVKNADGSDKYLPNGTFLSFANGTVGKEEKMTISWTFGVTGKVRISFEGMIGFGYGAHAQGATQRQLVDISVVHSPNADGVLQSSPVARIAAARQRKDAVITATDHQLIRGSNMTEASFLTAGFDSDETIAANYSLRYPPADGDTRFMGGYVADDYFDLRTEPRTITVNVVLTLLPLPANGWVNDDVLVYPPTLTVAC